MILWLLATAALGSGGCDPTIDPATEVIRVAGEACALADRFEPSGVVPAGPFAGRRIDTSFTRSLKLLDPEEAASFGPAPGERLVANVLHEGRFWIARIPTESLAEVIYQYEDVPGGLGHGQIRLLFSSQVPLIPQVPSRDSTPRAVSDLTFTADGTPPVGVDRPAGHWPLEQYPIAYRLMSTAAKVRIMTDAKGMHRVRQYRIEADRAAKERVLDEILRVGTGAGTRRMFNLIVRNCTNESIGILDRTLDYGPLRNLAARLVWYGAPKLIPLYMKVRGQPEGTPLGEELFTRRGAHLEAARQR